MHATTAASEPRATDRYDPRVPSTAIVWFRRDLRVHDHPALHHALERFDAIVPLFVVDDAILGGRWPSPNRWWFLARSLESLDGALRERGSRLVVVRGDPAELVPRIARGVGAAAVIASRDYTPYGRTRDERVAGALRDAGIAWEAGRGVLVHEPEDVRREDGGPFVVFSPFQRRWLALATRPILPAPRRLPTADAVVDGAGETDELLGRPQPTAELELLLEPGEPAARDRLTRWAASAALREYATGRDRLDRDGTSRLSQDLRWGLVSPVEVAGRTAGKGPGPTRFLSELAWRDFYAHFLWHEPRVAHESFRTALDGVWTHPDARAVEAWKDGRTGYTVVDAAMRQLRATGWMPNRARMIVASFLTKHLLVDWRVGEAHFMEHLVDGDPASNNGGWQWAASTGTDPQPYFRVFNPTPQGRRHDPDGAYVRRWVPELRRIPGGDVHEPPPGAYLPRIVDHQAARRAAIAAFEGRRSGGVGGPGSG
jgi:deoxyribodipyrimidine photo-lyase